MDLRLISGRTCGVSAPDVGESRAPRGVLGEPTDSKGLLPESRGCMLVLRGTPGERGVVFPSAGIIAVIAGRLLPE